MRLSRQAALRLIAFDAYDVKGCFFAGVEGNPVGTYPVQVAGRWVAAPAPVVPRLDVADPDAAAALVRTRLQAALVELVDDAARVGVLLSGGLDSSAVAAAAAGVWKRLGRDPSGLRAYHFLPPFGDGEVGHARAVAGHLGVELVEVAWPASQARSKRAALRRALDVPSTWIGPEPTLGVLARMQEDGCTLCLTGTGGDEAFAAYGMPACLPARGAVAARGRLAARATRGLASRALRRAWPWRRGAARRPLPPWLRARLRDVRPALHLAPPRHGLRGTAAIRDASLRCARQGLLVHGWARAAALHDLRAAHPLLDERVTDVVLAAPQWMLAVGEERKPLLRRVVRDLLPHAQVRRPKDQPYVEPWLRARLEEVGEGRVAELLRGGVLERAGLVPPGVGPGLVRAAVAGEAGALYRALAVVGAERWAQAHELPG